MIFHKYFKFIKIKCLGNFYDFLIPINIICSFGGGQRDNNSMIQKRTTPQTQISFNLNIFRQVQAKTAIGMLRNRGTTEATGTVEVEVTVMRGQPNVWEVSMVEQTVQLGKEDPRLEYLVMGQEKTSHSTVWTTSM